MWAVHSNPTRRGSWQAEEFLATGEAEVAAIMDALSRLDALPRMSRALDFGCGLGRLTHALGRRFDEVVGVDTSATMVRNAAELHAERRNMSFLVNEREDLKQLDTGTFDLVLSLITLQHVSSKAAIRSYIAEFVRVTAPGGIIVFQLPTSVGWQIRLHPVRLANRALRALPWAPRWALRLVMGHSMRLVGLPERQVRGLLERSGATVIATQPDGRTGTPVAPSMSYCARRNG